jgi:hypothetical protein
MGFRSNQPIFLIPVRNCVDKQFKHTFAGCEKAIIQSQDWETPKLRSDMDERFWSRNKRKHSLFSRKEHEFQKSSCFNGITIYIGGTKNPIMTKAFYLSPSGMFINTGYHLREGATLETPFTLPQGRMDLQKTMSIDCYPEI